MVVAASRFWGTREEEYNSLDSLLSDLLTLVDLVIVSIRTDLDKTDSLSRLGKKYSSLLGSKLILLCITQDHTLVQGLNYLLKTAVNWIHETNRKQKLPLLLLISVEIRPISFIKYLVSVVDDDTLCAGCAIPKEHVQLQDIGLEWLGTSQVVTSIEPVCSVLLSAFTCPWNTCCVWNINHLQLTGFLMVADWVTPPGMEEVAVIVAQQKLFGIAQRQVKLVYLPDPLAPCRYMQGYSLTRVLVHEEKMRSKQQRTRQIIQLLGSHKAAVVINCVALKDFIWKKTDDDD